MVASEIAAGSRTETESRCYILSLVRNFVGIFRYLKNGYSEIFRLSTKIDIHGIHRIEAKNVDSSMSLTLEG